MLADHSSIHQARRLAGGSVRQSTSSEPSMGASESAFILVPAGVSELPEGSVLEVGAQPQLDRCEPSVDQQRPAVTELPQLLRSCERQALGDHGLALAGSWAPAFLPEEV